MHILLHLTIKTFKFQRNKPNISVHELLECKSDKLHNMSMMYSGIVKNRISMCKNGIQSCTRSLALLTSWVGQHN